MRALFMYERPRITKAARRRRQKFVFYSALSFVMALSLFTLLAYLSHNENFLVRRVTVEGAAFVSENEIAERADAALEGFYLYFFPKRNFLLLPRDTLTSVIQGSFPAVNSLAISHPPFSFSELIISVHERAPFAVWCIRDLGHEHGDQQECFFTDREGILFSPAPDFSSSVYLRFVDTTASSTELGERALPEERFRGLTFFLQSLHNLDLSPQSVTIENGAAGARDYSIELTPGARILISDSRDFGETLNNISAFFGDSELVSSSEGFLKGVEYVDFRFGSRVYYK